MKELIVATTNKGKLREIEELLNDSVQTLYSLGDFPDFPPVVEDGINFRDNAVKKAQAAAEFTGKPVIADDSGLVVSALAGRPGVHSARFAGEGASDAANNAKLLDDLAGVPMDRRQAAFHCVIALCFPDGSCQTFDGELAGLILEQPRGSSGFGYDPLFWVPEHDLTLAELSAAVKNKISHRGKALAALKEYLATI